jgi:hypothetical protein
MSLLYSKPSHFGLSAIRERAEQLQAELVIGTGADRGTTVSLVVPGSVAYLRRSAAAGPVRLMERSPYRGIVEVHCDVKNKVSTGSISR